MRVLSTFAAVAFVLVAAGASTTTVLANLATQAATFSNIFGGAVVTQSASATGSLTSLDSAAFGLRSPATNDPFVVDTPLRANTGVGELTIAVLVQSLVNLQLLPQLDQSIPSRLFPGGIQIMNPAFSGAQLTLRTLLQHTSGLIDKPDFLTSPSTSGNGNAQTSLRAYAQSYFLETGDAGGTSVISARGIWDPTKQPGLPSSFKFARANIVLLSFILEQVLLENPTRVASDQKTVASMMYEMVFSPLGMTNTFIVLPDGSLPHSSSGFNVFASKVAPDTTAFGSALSTVTLYAAYTADYMIRTSASDVNKLMRALFLDTSSSFASIGTQLRASLIAVTDTDRVGVTHQGFGIVQFSSATVCSAASATLSLVAGCIVQDSTLFGMVGLGSGSAVTSMCTANIGTTGSSCSTAVFAFHPSAPLSLASTGYVAHVAAFNDLFIDAAVTDGATITPDTQRPTTMYGFGVFLGVFGACIGALFLAYIAEYVLQPVPLIGSISNKSYPTLQDHVNRSTQLMRRNQKDFD